MYTIYSNVIETYVWKVNALVGKENKPREGDRPKDGPHILNAMEVGLVQT